MNSLEKVLSDLMNMEYDMKALYVVLKALEKYYAEEGMEELNALICIVKGQMENSSKKLSNSIKELDKYLLECE